MVGLVHDSTAPHPFVEGCHNGVKEGHNEEEADTDDGDATLFV